MAPDTHRRLSGAADHPALVLLNRIALPVAVALLLAGVVALFEMGHDITALIAQYDHLNSSVDRRFAVQERRLERIEDYLLEQTSRRQPPPSD